MSRTTIALCAAVFAVTLLCEWREAQALQNIITNDPLSIGEPAPIKPTAPELTSPAPTAELPLLQLGPARLSNGSSVAPTLVNAETSKPAVSQKSDTSSDQINKNAFEQKPLGRANGSLSARPADESSSQSRGVLGRLDPRSNDIIRVLGALAVVIGLLLLTRTIVRRLGVLAPAAAQPSGVVEILARFPVGRGQQLILLKLARRVILAHQSGSNMSALSEMSDPDEVAALLARLEAGSSGRHAAKFKSALQEFEADHQALLNESPMNDSQRSGRSLAEVETEIVDLTRQKSKGFARLLGLSREAAR